MNLKDPETMNLIVSKVLRYGVLTSASIILLGTALLLASSALSETGPNLTYYPNQIPHGSFSVSLANLASGVLQLEPFALIELGALVLISTPVARVLISIFLFSAEGDRLYVYITSAVLVFLLFSMLVTPFIPGFHA
jgi:uncharacterized membrane protein